MTVIKLVEELDAGPIAAQSAFPVGPEDDAGAVYDRAAEVGGRAARARCFRTRRSRRSPSDGRHLRREDRPRRPRRSTSPSRRRRSNRVRALSPHIGARAELDGRPVTIWRARLEDGAVRPGRGAAGRRRRMGYEAVPARRCGERRACPARRLRGRPPGLRGRRVRRPRVRRRGRRGSTRATGRSPSGSRTARCSASATLDHGIEALGRRPVRKLDPPVRAALRLGAYQLGYLDGVAPHAAVNESVELVRAARLERAVAVHERGDAAARRRAPRSARRRCPKGR